MIITFSSSEAKYIHKIYVKTFKDTIAQAENNRKFRYDNNNKLGSHW